MKAHAGAVRPLDRSMGQDREPCPREKPRRLDLPPPHFEATLRASTPKSQIHLESHSGLTGDHLHNLIEIRVRSKLIVRDLQHAAGEMPEVEWDAAIGRETDRQI
jgi:hypothetical protein